MTILETLYVLFFLDISITGLFVLWILNELKKYNDQNQ